MSMGCIRDSSKPIDYKALSILNAITTSNSNIVFESLMKISSNPSEFLEAWNKSKILESIEHIINFKDKINYNSSVITKELLEDYFIDIFSIEQSRFLQNDNIFNNFKYDVDKSFAPSQGLSIIADEDCDSHDEDEWWCISDSEIDIEVFDPENTHRLQYNKNEFFHEDGEKFSKSESWTEDREIKNKEAKAYKKGKKQLKVKICL